MKKYSAVIIENPDNPEELMLQFPEELLEKVGWKEGTVLNWQVEDGTIILDVANTQQSVDSNE